MNPGNFNSGDIFPTLPTQAEIDTMVTNLNSFLQNEAIPLKIRDFVYSYSYLKLTGNNIFDCSVCLNRVVDRANSDQKSSILQSLVNPD